MKLSILIVNWNSKDYLRQCLRTVRETCAELDPQVVVVDGGSFDGSAEMLAADFPEVVFVQSPENIGFGRSNNLGFTKVTGDLLLLLNPDTELRPGAVASLIRCLEELPDAGLIGARLLNSDGSLQYSSVHSLPTPWNVAFDSDWGRRRWWRRQGPPAGGLPCEVEAVSGACMLLRTKDFRKLGGFDSRYFMYAEDMDLCFRLRQTCGRIYHDPRAEVLHHGGGSSRTQFSKFSAVMIREAVRVYIETHHGKAQVLLYRFLMALSALTRMAILVPIWLLASGGKRITTRVSLLKWISVFRWALGRETWAEERFQAPSSIPSTDFSIAGSG
ncbi:MAG: glycosyltransferase family 2 protein [Verrucomicrobiae bacterium]|nr:glycosyltransferase family 2 protein [Verrucomicrobiae bacterium]